jgi:3-oxoacyl-[acyl-carrier-protein] synthase II
VELRAIERIAGESASSIHVSSTKDRHGHAIAAAGILEFHVLLSSMDMELVPSNLNLQKPIDTPLILPIEGNISKKIRFGMTNNFAFGGVNCSLTVKNLKL